MFIQRSEHHENSHPYSPWDNANQIWVTNLVYIQAQMTMKSANTLLQGLKEEVVKIEGVNFSTVKEMMSQINNANYVPVYLFYLWYSYQ